MRAPVQKVSIPGVGTGTAAKDIYPYTSLGPCRLQPRVLRKLADVLARLISVVFETSWTFGHVPSDWKKGSQKINPRNYRFMNFVDGKIMKLSLQE